MTDTMFLLENHLRQTLVVNVLDKRKRATGSFSLTPHSTPQGSCTVTYLVAYSPEVERFVSRGWLSRTLIQGAPPEATVAPVAEVGESGKRGPARKGRVARAFSEPESPATNEE